jgi:Uma2 family endonuclease
MAGASENHNTISLNVVSEFRMHLKKTPCRPFASDMKLKTSTGSFRYPDIMVVCNNDLEDKYFKTKPVILVEVLSRSTRKADEKEKQIEYINIPTLKEYVIIEQDVADVTVYRKSDDWRSTHYFLGEEIHFESIDLTIPVSEIYLHVENDDVRQFLAGE